MMANGLAVGATVMYYVGKKGLLGCCLVHLCM